MIYISHRANLNGPNTASHGENHPRSIQNAIKQNYDVEIDVWFINGEYVLGHDYPQYKMDIEQLRNNRLWCHAKNLEALHKLMDENIHCFFHNIDDATITSLGWVWTYPGKTIIGNRSIAVMPEKINDYDFNKAGGVCSDFITISIAESKRL